MLLLFGIIFIIAIVLFMLTHLLLVFKKFNDQSYKNGAFRRRFDETEIREKTIIAKMERMEQNYKNIKSTMVEIIVKMDKDKKDKKNEN